MLGLYEKNVLWLFLREGRGVFWLIFLAFFFTGCMGKAKVKSEGDTHQPDWILNTPVEPGFLYGVGSAEVFGGDDAGASGRAKDIARVDLVKQIEIKVSGEVSQEIEEITRNGKTKLTESLRQSVKNRVPEFELSNVTGAESHKAANGKRVTVMVKLDVNKELEALRNQISALDQELGDYARKLSEIPQGGLSRLRVIAPALVLSEQRAGLQARFNALEPRKQIAPLLSEEIKVLVRQIYQRIAQLKISVQPEGVGDRSMQTGLIAQLTKRGIKISPEGQGDIQLFYDLRVNNIPRGGTYFAMTEGDIWIKDEVGRVVRALQAKAKGTSTDPGESRSRSIRKLSGQLGKALLEALF